MNSNTFLVLLILLFVAVEPASAQLKVRNDAAIQIGYDSYRYLSFGEELASPNNGKYAVEYWNGGLNFWKPWPTANFGNYVLFLRDDHHIGMGSAGNATNRLVVSGTARSSGWLTLSDRRLKTNVQPLNNSLEKVLRLDGVTYQYKQSDLLSSSEQPQETDPTKVQTMTADGTEIPKEQRLGFIAQDVREVVPEAISTDEYGIMSINYSELIPLLVESSKAQQQQISDLESAVRELTGGTETGKRGDRGQDTRLYGNYPNPFDQQTTVRYALHEQDAAGENFLVVFSQEGTELQRYPLRQGAGEGRVVVSTDGLSSGTYFYALVVNGMQMDSNMMVVAK
ncbi:MAG: tail fiber domain-containing protein [Bacteroidota bacterium]